MMRRMFGMAVLAAGMMLGGAQVALAEFGAFAVGTVNSNAIGIAGGANSPQEAKRYALQICRNNGGIACKVKYRWSGPGCYFATNGSNPYGQFGWGSGTSPMLAVAACQSRGLVCQAPTSACNQW